MMHSTLLSRSTRALTVALTVMLSFMGGKAVAAETADFNSGLPTGWSLVGDINNDSDRARSGKGLWTSAKSTTANYVVTSKVTGTFEFYARAYNKNYASTVVVYEYTGTGLGSQLYTTGSMQTSSTPTWSKYSLTVSGNKQLAIVLNYAAIDDVAYTPGAADVSGPGLAVSDGDAEVTDGYSYSFGLCDAGATHDFTLYNPGTESVTLAIGATGGFAVSQSSITLAAKATGTLTVTMPASTATGTVTVTPSDASLQPLTISLSGTVKDPSKLFIDFEDNAMPDTWSLDNGWSISGGMAVNNGTASNIVSGKVTVAVGGEKIFFDYKGYNTWGGTYNYVKVYYATTGNGSDADWTLISNASFACDDNTTWHQAEVNVPAAAKYIALQGRYVYIDNFYGLTLPLEANMKVTAADHDFGVITASDTYVFTIQNTGMAALTGITVASSDSRFTITGAPATIAAGAEAEVTVTMSAAQPGIYSGTVTVAADGFTVAAGSAATFSVSGAVMDPAVSRVTFDDNQAPQFWENNGMTFSDGAVSGSRSTYNLTTQKLAFAADGFIAIKAKALESWGYVKVEASTDDGATWNTLVQKDVDGGLSADAYTTFAVSITKAVNRLRLTCYESAVDEIAGLEYDNDDPLFALYAADADGQPSGDAISEAQTIDLGDGITQTQTVTFVVRNERLGNMTVEAAVAAGAVGVTAAVDKTTIGSGQSATVTIQMPYDADNTGLKQGTVTISGKNSQGTQLAAVAVTVSGHTRQAGKLFVDFTDGLPTGWTAGDWTAETVDGDGVMHAGTTLTANRMVSQKVTVADGESLFVTAVGQTVNVYYSPTATGFTAANKKAVALEMNGQYQEVELTGIPATTKYLAFEGQNAYITTVYGFAPDDSDPQMELWIGDSKAATGTETIDYGMVAAATTKEIQIRNANTGSLLVTAIELPEGYQLSGVTAPTESAPLAIAAGESKTVGITLTTDAPGQKQGTVTVKAADQQDFTLTVSGYVFDTTKMLVDFSDNQLPAGWTNGDGGAQWQFQDGMAYGQYASYKNARMRSPRLIVASGDKMVLQLKGNASYAELRVEAYEPYGTTPVKTFNFDSEAQATYQSQQLQQVTVSGLEAGEYRLVFDAYNTYIDNINGFTVSQNDPVLAVYADAAASSQLTLAEQCDFGFQGETATAHYYLKNTGTGTLTVTGVTVGEGSKGITAAVEGEASAAAGSGVIVIAVTMDATATGQKQGTVTVETNAGTLTIEASGMAVDKSRNYVDFTQVTEFPAGWDKGNWTVSTGDKAAKAASTAGTIETTRMTAAAGEPLYIEALGSSSYYSQASLAYSFSTDNGQTWSEDTDVSSLLSGDEYRILTISDIAAADAETVVKVRLTGANVSIRRICGFLRYSEPLLSVSEADAADHDFGMQTGEASYTITVKNEGDADLTDVTATLAAGADSEYTAVLTVDGTPVTTIAAGGEALLTITQKYDAAKTGSHSDRLTIAAGNVSNTYVISLTGKTRDGSLFFADFDAEGATLPEGWTGWNVSSHELSAGLEEKTLRTSVMAVAEGQTMTFDARRQYSSDAPTLKVRYSTDGTVTWSEYKDYSAQITTNQPVQLTVSGVPAGNVVLEIAGRRVLVDNIYGFRRNDTAPLLSLTQDDEPVATGSCYDFETLTAAAGAKSIVYVLKNTGNGTLSSAITAEGDVTVTPASVALAAGESAELTVTMPVEAPFGSKQGVVTIMSQDGIGSVQLLFTGNTLDPTAFRQDFADGKLPAGWYNSGWTFSENAATAAGESVFITERLAVSGTDDVLTYQARQTSSLSKLLEVSYSTDRKQWTTTDVTAQLTGSDQALTLKGLEAGNYYLRFRGKYAVVSLLQGWHTTEAPEHDIYVVDSKQPQEEMVPATNYAATVTVASLRAAENVTAELYFVDASQQQTLVGKNSMNIAAGAAADIAVSGNAPSAEGSYKVFVKVSASGITESTAETSVTLKHIRSMEIASVQRVLASGESEVIDADAANMFSATFALRLRNTGTTALTAEQTAVTLYAKAPTALEPVVFRAAAEAALEAGATTTVNIPVTTSAMEGGEFKFYAKEDLGGTLQLTDTVRITVNAAAPKLQMADAGGKTVESGFATDFGMSLQAVSRTFTITNSGTADLVLNSITAPKGFTVSPEITDANRTIAPQGGSLQLTIAMDPAEAVGTLSGNVAVSYRVDAATNNEFLLAVSGYAMDDAKLAADFNDGAMPALWQATGITYADGAAVAVGDAEILLPQADVASGERLAVRAMLGGAMSWGELRYQLSTDGGASWTTKSSNFADALTQDGYTLIYIDGIAEGTYLVKLLAYNLYIDAINGFTHNDSPLPTEVISLPMADDGKPLPVFNLRGQRVTSMKKGQMYISGGKTFVY